MSSYTKLIDGHRKFRARYMAEENSAWRTWAKEQQNPKVMIIGCSDSRVNPVIITQASLGDIFVVNNVANLVPPYKPCGNTHHSTSAAIEYAVTQLKVAHIIVMGHSGCGGIRALMTEQDTPAAAKAGTETAEDSPYSFIGPWMQIVRPAAVFSAEEKATLDPENRATLCEKRASLISLENLASFPWVKDAMAQKKLALHAWHFDIGSGVIEAYDPTQDAFTDLILKHPQDLT